MADPQVHPLVRRGAAYAWRLLVIAAAGYAVLWLLGQLSVIALPIAVALLVVRALDPIASRLVRHGVPPTLTALLVVGGLLGAIGGAGWFIVPELAGEFADLGPTVSAAISDLEDWLVADAPVEISRSDITTARDWVRDRAVDVVRGSGGALSNGAFLLANALAGLLLAVLLSFFMVKDGPRALAWGRGFVPSGRRGIVDELARRAWHTLGGYLAGSAVLGTVEGLVIGAAVWIAGGALVLPIMILTFAAAFVPIVGAITAGAVAVLVTLVTAGTAEAVVVLIVAVLVQQLDGDLLAPLVFGRAVDLHPAVILVVIAAGGSLFGFVGVLLAVPVTAVITNSLAVVRSHDTGSGQDLTVTDLPGGLLLPDDTARPDPAALPDQPALPDRPARPDQP